MDELLEAEVLQPLVLELIVRLWLELKPVVVLPLIRFVLVQLYLQFY